MTTLESDPLPSEKHLEQERVDKLEALQSPLGYIGILYQHMPHLNPLGFRPPESFRPVADEYTD